MTKKLEEIFNLDNTAEDTPKALSEKMDHDQSTKDDSEANVLIQQKLGLDKIDTALPQVDGLADDQEIDKYSEDSYQAYKDLMDLGMNVEPRLAGRIMEVASSMMANAKNLKVDKKLKMIELQLKKLKLDQNKPEDEAVSGTGTVVADRNELIKQILAASKDDK